LAEDIEIMFGVTKHSIFVWWSLAKRAKFPQPPLDYVMAIRGKGTQVETICTLRGSNFNNGFL
jgi:hypothetical protein